MKGLIEQGCQVAFSLRAQGKVQPDPANGYVIVQSPIQICTWDWVLNPSHNKAYMDHICEQAFNNFMNLDRFSKETALCESANIFENGELIPITETYIPKVVDYTKSYHKDIKSINEFYIPEDADTLISINENTVMIGNSEKNITKKVVLEDYIIKDIRRKIKNL